MPLCQPGARPLPVAVQLMQWAGQARAAIGKEVSRGAAAIHVVARGRLDGKQLQDVAFVDAVGSQGLTRFQDLEGGGRGRWRRWQWEGSRMGG